MAEGSSGYVALNERPHGGHAKLLALVGSGKRVLDVGCDVGTMELPFDPGSFDAVLCGDLVEHLRDPGAFMTRVRPPLRDGGRLVFSTPNVANWALRLQVAGRWRYSERGILDRTHVHLFTRNTLPETLGRAEYRVLELDHRVLVPLVASPVVERAVHAVGRLRPPLFAYQFVAAAVPA